MPPEIASATRVVIDSYNSKSGIGIPIGSLTSQIFANIYLNEWDRYVRNHLRSLAYLRYGDDTLIFARTRREAHIYRKQGANFLKIALGLDLNFKNDAIFPTSAPAHFCGHVITKDYTVVDRTTTIRSLNRADLGNAASYKALKIAKWPKQQINWQLLNKLDEILKK